MVTVVRFQPLGLQALQRSANKKGLAREGKPFLVNGGEKGIRTLDTLPYTRFPGELLQPLGHLSAEVALLEPKHQLCSTSTVLQKRRLVRLFQRGRYFTQTVYEKQCHLTGHA